MVVKFSKQEIGKYSILSIHGDMLGNVGNGIRIRTYVSELLSRGSKHIVFDVSKLQSPSSDLVYIVTDTFKKVKKDGGTVGVVYQPPCGSDIFDMCGVYSFVSHYHGIEALRKEVFR